MINHFNCFRMQLNVDKCDVWNADESSTSFKRNILLLPQWVFDKIQLSYYQNKNFLFFSVHKTAAGWQIIYQNQTQMLQKYIYIVIYINLHNKNSIVQ